tara:strand:- start:6061 stop:6240 length:180 start_codon:yes stop_codon:yes gene_type:complete
MPVYARICPYMPVYAAGKPYIALEAPVMPSQAKKAPNTANCTNLRQYALSGLSGGLRDT